MQMSQLTSSNNYFEDFEEGQVMRHMRGKTVSEVENVLITNMVMNTAQAHFNEHMMQTAGANFFPRIISYGGVNLALIFGMATQDTCENALAEVGMDNIKFTTPVGHGDTIYAVTKILELKDSEREDAGLVRFRHIGFNQDEKIVAEGERTVLIKRRSHWGK